MKTVKFLSQVNKSKCQGDKLCKLVCPTGAIRMVPRPKPVILEMDQRTVDPLELDKLCAKAHLLPDQPICLCTGTTAKEMAAAILRGAKSLSEIPLMTGAFSGCGIYCLAPIQRLFKEHGLEITPAKGHQWYEINVSLQNISEAVKEKYPGYFLKEDLELLESMKP